MMVLRRQKKTREKWSLPQIDNLAISPLVKSEVRFHRRMSLRCKFTFAAFEAENQILMMGIWSRRVEPFDLHVSGRRVAPHAVALVLRGTVHVLKIGFCKFWVELDEVYLVADFALQREDDLLAIELRVHVVLKWRSTFFGNVFEIVRDPIKISWNGPTLTSPCLRSLLLVGIGAPELSFSRISLDRKSCTVCIGVLL